MHGGRLGCAVVAGANGNASDRADGVAETGFSFPFLLASEIEEHGVIAMAPVYVAFVAEPNRNINDLNIGNLELRTGYHLARHDGDVVRASVAQWLCAELSEDDCGESIVHYETAQRLALDEPLTFSPGGDEDLVDVLGVLTGEVFR